MIDCFSYICEHNYGNDTVIIDLGITINIHLCFPVGCPLSSTYPSTKSLTVYSVPSILSLIMVSRLYDQYGRPSCGAGPQIGSNTLISSTLSSQGGELIFPSFADRVHFCYIHWQDYKRYMSEIVST